MQKNNNTTHARSLAGLAILGFICLGFLIYANTFHSPFYMDDYESIKDNPGIRMTEISWECITKIFHSLSENDSLVNYRPLAYLTFALNYYFGGYQVFGYHVVNTAIHILTCIFLFLFIKTTYRLSRSNAPGSAYFKKNTVLIPFFAALIWLVHPVNTQSVTYIVQRMTSMSAMFYLLAFLFYIKARKLQLSLHSKKNTAFNDKLKPYAYFTACTLSGILAIASKQTAATLPVFIFIYEWLFFQGSNPSWLKRNSLWALAVVLIFSVLGLFYLGGDPFNKIMSLYVSPKAIQHFTVSERVLTELRIVIYYISLFFFPGPSRLHFDYYYPVSTSFITPATTLICLFAISCLFILAGYTAKKNRIVSFCILWFFGNLAVESSFIGLDLVFEHRTYLPFMMLSLMAVILAFRLVHSKWKFVVLMGIIVCIFSVWTYQRNISWQNPAVFWKDNIKKSPANPRPLSIYGSILLENKQVDQAIGYFKKALRLKPDYKQVYAILGKAYAQAGRSDDAAEYFQNALLIRPDDVKILNEFANSLLRNGEIEKAITYYNKALKSDPGYAITYNNMGNAYFNKNNLNLAIRYYRKAIDLQPDYKEARHNLALAYKNAANLYFKQNNIKEAIANYKKALQADPGDAQTHYNLGIAFFRNNNINSSIKELQKALEINPDYLQARQALIQLQSIRKNLLPGGLKEN